jgi:hypothetical protein
MTQDQRTLPAGPGAALASAAADHQELIGELVEHLHFDRTTRQWWTHPEVAAALSERAAAGSILNDGVRE